MPKPSKTRHLALPGYLNSSWRHLGSAKGGPEAQQRSPADSQAAWRRLLALWGLPEEALGPAWEIPRDHFAAKSDPKLDYVAANLFEVVFV